jgi:3-deoxy-D-manno-octulosonic-acid transferase
MLLLDVLERIDIPGLLTIIVPRHPQRFDAVAQMLEQRQISYARRSRDEALQPATQVLLGDSMGEMFAYYAACDFAFIGGSLRTYGAHNLLESCALAKHVIVGSSTYISKATELVLRGRRRNRSKTR